MKDSLIKYVNAGEWKLAGEELLQLMREGRWDDELAIYAAAISFATGDDELAFDYIREGLIYNYKNYELYVMLGNYYANVKKNINQAWLCYENAEYYCTNEADMGIIRQCRSDIEKQSEYNVRKVSIVLLTYNLKALNIQCIESIRNTNAASVYEIIVVDNASTDGTAEWLKEQKDIKLICNSRNKGFPTGCNQGIEIADKQNDIFLLNSDTIVLPNSIFWLRMGLYENEKVGATGSMSDYKKYTQGAIEKLNGVQDIISYGIKVNVPMQSPYEKKVYLSGFAMLIKRKALEEVGLLDERFSPGQSEDVDFGVRMNLAGWRMYTCWNSFIIHYGNGNGNNIKLWSELVETNDQKFKDKWNLSTVLSYYDLPRTDICDLIKEPEGAAFRVLEVGCGCGATLVHIERLWPKAEVMGIEIEEGIAKIGANLLDIIQGDIEQMELPYPEKYFDYIIFADVLEHLREPEKTVQKMTDYIKDGGQILCSIPNLMNQNVIVKLLQGKFEYTDAGILDRTHIHFFTMDSIQKMLKNCGLEMIEIKASYNEPTEEPQECEILKALFEIPSIADRELFKVYQFIFSAGKTRELC